MQIERVGAAKNDRRYFRHSKRVSEDDLEPKNESKVIESWEKKNQISIRFERRKQPREKKVEIKLERERNHREII